MSSLKFYTRGLAGITPDRLTIAYDGKHGQRQALVKKR
jgi:hypothetical protein